MGGKITRRTALKTGATAAGLGLTVPGIPHATTHPENEIGVSAFWEPGPDKNLKRDLTPGKTPIRLGGHLSFNGTDSPADAVEKIRTSGCTSCVTGPKPWENISDSLLREFKASLKQHDVVVYELAGYTNMIDPRPTERQKRLKQLARCIEIADMIGCPMVGTISGSCDPVNIINVHPDNWTLETWKLLVDCCKQVLGDTSGCKAAIGMEAQITTNIDGPKAQKRLMDDVGDPRCAVNLDPTNMISLSNYYHTTELINECFDLLGESILGCHAKDTYIFPDTQTVHVQEVCAGRGVMDYETYLVRMSRMKWPRTILPEHVPPEQLVESWEYIREVAARVGVTIHD